MKIKGILNITYSDLLLLINGYKDTFFVSKNEFLDMKNELDKNRVNVLIDNEDKNENPIFITLQVKSSFYVKELNDYNSIYDHPLWKTYIESTVFGNLKTINEKIKNKEISLNSLKIQFEDYLNDINLKPNSYAFSLKNPISKNYK